MPTREIRVVIASPSDVIVERDWLLSRLETKFRKDHFEELTGARIIVEGWETLPSQPGYTQDIINRELVKKADILVAVFRHKLGAPTFDPASGNQRSLSGTAEELLQALNPGAKPLGMAYYYEFAPSPDSIPDDAIEWGRLEGFKKEIQDRIRYRFYKSEVELIDMVCKDLCNIIRGHELFRLTEPVTDQ